MPSADEGPVRSPTPSSRRSSHAQPDCILSVGAQNLPAAIIEERGGTLYVVIQGSPQFWVDDAGHLKTPEKDLEVCVFNIVRLEAEEDDPAGDIPEFRIGLERLGTVANEVPADEDDTDEDEDDEPEDDEVRVKPKKTTTGGLRTLIVLLAGVVLLAVGVLTWQQHLGKWIVFPSWPDPAKQQPGKPAASSSAAPQPDADAGRSAVPAAVAKSLRLPGVEPFLRPEVAKWLDLSPAQNEALQRTDQVTQIAMRDLEKYWGDSDRLEKRSALLEEARQQALQVLTDPQRELWDEAAR
jgi:hypothetical protein